MDVAGDTFPGTTHSLCYGLNVCVANLKIKVQSERQHTFI